MKAIIIILTINLTILITGKSQSTFASFTLNGSSSSLYFNSCEELQELNFQANLGYFIIGRVKYTWKLLRNNTVIDEYVQNDILNDCDGVICELPIGIFSEPPLSGNYSVHLKAQRYTCSPINIGGLLCLPGQVLIDETTATINVSRFDDSFSCKCENPENFVISQNIMNAVNNVPFPLEARVRNTISTQWPHNGVAQLTLIAGKKIELKQGFSTKGNFHAFIDECEVEGMRVFLDSNESNYFLDTLTKVLNVIDDTDRKKNLFIVEENRSFNKKNMPIIFPNPTNGLINIELNSDKPYFEIEVFSLLGELVYVNKVNSSKLTFDLSQYPKGMYLVKIKQDNRYYHEKISYY
ncbi:MAG: T9SS type A sorting domain-containing protein [Vicingaceae bacterium]|nr:T9SS type A sorting domain-containing protein [Vicingaceae bacterium]